MEYVYAAMLLHKAGTDVKEDSMKKVLEAAGVKADEVRIKALVAALDGINIDEAIEKSAMVAPAVSGGAAVSAGAPAEEKAEAKEEKKEKEDETKADDAAAGLGALFG